MNKQSAPTLLCPPARHAPAARPFFRLCCSRLLLFASDWVNRHLRCARGPPCVSHTFLTAHPSHQPRHTRATHTASTVACANFISLDAKQKGFASTSGMHARSQPLDAFVLEDLPRTDCWILPPMALIDAPSLCRRRYPAALAGLCGMRHGSAFASPWSLTCLAAVARAPRRSRA